MSSAELDAIRAKRLAELSGGAAPGGMSGSANLPPGLAPAAPPGAEGQEAERRKAMEDMRASILQQVLSNDARERLGRLAMVKPDKARAVEEYILGMARSGRVQQKITENELIDLLEQVSEQGRKKTKITIARRRFDDDDDDEEDYGF